MALTLQKKLHEFQGHVEIPYNESQQKSKT